VAEGNDALTGFDSSCFTGRYVTELPPGYFERLSEQRSEEGRKNRRPA